MCGPRRARFHARGLAQVGERVEALIGRQRQLREHRTIRAQSDTHDHCLSVTRLHVPDQRNRASPAAVLTGTVSQSHDTAIWAAASCAFQFELS